MYGLDGTCEVEGVSYRGLADATGYGSVDGLGGANCRHSFGPWAPGTPRAYEPDPPHPSGLTGDEVYRLRQGQRRRERAIREAKRDLAGAQMVAGRDGSLANIAEVERAKARLAARQKGMRDFIAEANSKGSVPVLHRNPRREWAGDMPRVRKTDASRRTMGEFLDGDAAKRSLKARGMTRDDAKLALSSELGSRGIPEQSWKYLSRSTQRELFGKAVNSGAISQPMGSGRKRAEAHAKRYYEELVNRNRASTIAKIAEASGMDVADAERAFMHLFVEEHDLADGHRRFDPDYYMAQSMQRLIDTGGPLPHDLVLFRHEALEARYMAEGMTQGQAHDKANELYNYQKMLKEWIDGREGA